MRDEAGARALLAQAAKATAAEFGQHGFLGRVGKGRIDADEIVGLGAARETGDL